MAGGRADGEVKGFMEENNVALKEWAVVAKALGEGEQIFLVRKGGIREEKREFRVEHQQFFLYPTYEHQREADLKSPYRQALKEISASHDSDDKVRISHWARVEEMATIETREAEKVEQLAPYCIWTADFLKERLAWRPKKPLRVLLLRVFRLPVARVIDVLPEYQGCLSWVNLRVEIPASNMAPVLGDAEFSQKVKEIRQALG